jgi:hypothetical protein
MLVRMKALVKRGGVWLYRREVPSRLRSIIGKSRGQAHTRYDDREPRFLPARPPRLIEPICDCTIYSIALPSGDALLPSE